MKIVYRLTESDFLAFQMYCSGNSQQQKRRRLRGRFMVPVAWGLLALISFSIHEPLLGYLFSAVSVLWVIFYLHYSRWHHVRHFKNHIRENYQGRIGVEAAVQLEAEGLYASSSDGEGMMKYSGVEELVELDSLFLIRLKQATTLLLPRASVEKAQLEAFMKEVSKRTGLEIKNHSQMRWR